MYKDEKIPPQLIYRWKLMMAVAAALAVIVLYLYHSKIGGPVRHLESNVESQVVTVPVVVMEEPLEPAN